MSVKDLIKASLEDKSVAAYDAFVHAIEPKLETALAAKEKTVAQSIFKTNGQDEE